MCFIIAQDDSFCVHGELRLWSAYDNTPSNEGILQICSYGQWTAICDRYSSSSCYIGRIACKAMGYEGAYSQWDIDIYINFQCIWFMHNYTHSYED